MEKQLNRQLVFGAAQQAKLVAKRDRV